jgi:predicted O-linked N-acetylglucosamine transferase (SPINDLY family)
MVREDKVDILVELTGHTANNKLGMMACRPAPVQVCWRLFSLSIFCEFYLVVFG